MVKRHALRAVFALAVSTASTGCFTTTGALIGNLVSNSLNQGTAPSSPPQGPRHSATRWTVAGLGIGLVVDSLLIYGLARDAAGTENGGF